MEHFDSFQLQQDYTSHSKDEELKAVTEILLTYVK